MRPLAFALVTGVLAAACGGAASETQVRSAQTIEACPLGVPQASAVVEDTREGVAVTFTTARVHEAELRMRVGAQAGQRGPGEGTGPGHDGVHGLSHRHGLQLWKMPESTTKVVVVDWGARLELTPVDRARRDELARMVRERVAELMNRPCE